MQSKGNQSNIGRFQLFLNNETHTSHSPKFGSDINISNYSIKKTLFLVKCALVSKGCKDKQFKMGRQFSKFKISNDIRELAKLSKSPYQEDNVMSQFLPFYRWFIIGFASVICVYLVQLISLRNLPFWLEFVNGDNSDYSKSIEITYLEQTGTMVNLIQLMVFSQMVVSLFSYGYIITDLWFWVQLIIVPVNCIIFLTHVIHSFDDNLEDVKFLNRGPARHAALRMILISFYLSLICFATHYQSQVPLQLPLFSFTKYLMVFSNSSCGVLNVIQTFQVFRLTTCLAADYRKIESQIFHILLKTFLVSY